tara:strand:- start:2023 stop:2394 length:372 start_codon:yes stop_codon:yes gene_type:complete
MISNKKSWADINPDATAQIVKKLGGDGWSILSQPFFEEYLHENELSVLDAITKTHESDYKHPKLTIYKEGYPVDSLEGVHALDLLYTIAKDLELEDTLKNAGAKMGRGFQAEELAKGILEYLP